MPNKTIYVPNSEQEVFAQAQKLSGQSLSNTIVTAMRQFADGLRGNTTTAKWISVEVGEVIFQKKRFRGFRLGIAEVVIKNKTKRKLIAVFGPKGMGDFRGHRSMETDDQSEYQVEHIEVFRTEKGNFAVHKNLVSESQTNKKTLDVCKDMTEVNKLIPDELFMLIRNDLDHDEVEDLDI